MLKKYSTRNMENEEDQLYRENIMDHYKNPRNTGHVESCSFSKKDFNPLCGDEVEMFVNTVDGQIGMDSKINEVRFIGRGCAISQASSSMLTEYVKGKTLKEVIDMNTDNIKEMIGTDVGPARIKCAMLPLRALQKGIIKVDESKIV